MTIFRWLATSALATCALGAVACTASIDEPAGGSASAVPSAVTPARSPAPTPTMFYSTPDDPPSAPVATVRPAVAAAASGARDAQCVEAEDTTSICSLAAGRSHFYSCAVGGAPPKALPACKAVGSKHWCCS